MKKKSLTAVLAIGAGLALAVAVPLSASAHIALTSNTAKPGSYVTLSYQVPSESDTAVTNTITLDLPSDTPFTSVRYMPVPGWTARLVTTKLPTPIVKGDSTITEAVTQVVFTASAGSGIGQGALQIFSLSVGPVPDTGQIVLPVEQSYSDGSTVSWSDTGSPAAHPAPVLYVNDPVAVVNDGDGDAGAAPTATAAPEAVGLGGSSSSGAAGPDILARVLGIAGLVVGAVGLVFGITARRDPKKA